MKRADDEKRLNATYIVSVARKLGCSVFLLPEDIMEVRATIYNGFSGYLKQHLLGLLGVNDENDGVWDVVTGKSEDDSNINGEYYVLESSETLIGE